METAGAWLAQSCVGLRPHQSVHSRTGRAQGACPCRERGDAAMVGAPLLRGTHVAGSVYSASDSITVSQRLHQARREVPDARWLTATSHSLCGRCCWDPHCPQGTQVSWPTQLDSTPAPRILCRFSGCFQLRRPY